VSARIELNGKLLFINTEHHGVKLDGSDEQPVRIKVDPVR
jgi:putative lipoprotein